MLVNPFTANLEVIEGTRWLKDPLGLAGVRLIEPKNPLRVWTIYWILAPARARALGGIRAKLVDDKGFVTFCNQRDLEVLLGYGQPGKYCSWLRKDYMGPDDDEWYGLCCDEEDLSEDLFEQECRMRQTYPPHTCLPNHIQFSRRVHIDQGNDVEELLLLLWDVDRSTGYGPDPRRETVGQRWSRVERNRVVWDTL